MPDTLTSSAHTAEGRSTPVRPLHPRPSTGAPTFDTQRQRNRGMAFHRGGLPSAQARTTAC